MGAGRRRRRRPDPLATAFPVGPVCERLGATQRQQAAGVVGDGGVGPLAAERPDGHGIRLVPRIGGGPGVGSLPTHRPLGAHDEAAPDPRGVGVVDDRGDGDRATGVDGVGDGAELGEGLRRDRLDEDVEDAAAGQADREGVVVGDAVPLQHGGARGHDLLAELVDRALDAAAGHGPHGLAAGPDEHRGAGWARRRPEGCHDGADPDRLAGVPPLHQLGKHVTHVRPPPSAPRTPPSSAPRRSGRRGAGPP